VITDIIKHFLDSLPVAFSVDTQETCAVTITYGDSTEIECVVDGLDLTLRPLSSFKVDQALDLTGKTVTQVVAEINALGNYVATLQNSGTLNALRFWDTTTLDGKLYVFDNINYAIAKAFAMEMGALKEAVAETARQAVIQSATTFVLDYWGSYIGVTRTVSETDASYAQRILDAIRQTRANNKSIELMVQRVFALESTVLDLDPVTIGGMTMWDPTQAAPIVIGDTRYPLYQYAELDLPYEFSVNFQDWFFTSVSLSEFRQIAVKLSEAKAAGTMWLIHTADVGGMLMNCPYTPINDTILLPVSKIYHGSVDSDGLAFVNPYRGTFWLGQEDRMSFVLGDTTDLVGLPTDALLLSLAWEDHDYQPIVTDTTSETPIMFDFDLELEEPILFVTSEYNRFLAGDLYIEERDT
jgi:hypothetical protein